MSENGKNTAVGLVVIATVVFAAWFGISSLFKGNETSAEGAQDTNSISEVVAQIESNNNIGGICSYSDEKTEYFSTASVLKTGTTNFINIARQIFQNDSCTTFQYALAIDVKNSTGDVAMQPILVFNTDKDKFNAYNWDNLVNNEIGEQLQNDGILTKIRTDIKDVTLSSVVYGGDEDSLQ